MNARGAVALRGLTGHCPEEGSAVSCFNLNEDITFAIRAGESLPLVERYEASLRWLLDIAAGAIPEERSALDRLRRAVGRLVARRGARIADRELKIALGGVFEAIGTLRSMVCRRQVPHIRISPRIVVFEVAALNTWITARRVGVANDDTGMVDAGDTAA
jgi:hypothetical protein